MKAPLSVAAFRPIVGPFSCACRSSTLVIFEHFSLSGQLIAQPLRYSSNTSLSDMYFSEAASQSPPQ